MDIIKTNEELNKLKNENDMLLIYFRNNSCGVCHVMKPKIEEMLEKYPKIKSIEVEIENSMKLSADYNVFTIPVVILFIQGKETIRKAGIISMKDLDQEILRYYELLYGID